MNGYHDEINHQRFDFVGNHARLGLVQRKTFEKIVLESDNNVIYEYEFQLKVESAQNDNPAIHEVPIDGDNPDQAIMANFSLIELLENQILGFTDNSLQVNQIKTNNDGVPTGSVPVRDNDLGKHSPDFIEIKLDRVYNRIMFEYMFESGHVDLDIRFKVVLKNQFQMSMVNSRNFTFHAESHQYHENGLRTGKVEMVDKLTKGYDRTTLEAHFQQDNTRDEDSKMDVDRQTNDEPVNVVFTEEDIQNFDIGNLRSGRVQQNRRKNKTKIQKHPRDQNIEESDELSSGSFSSSGNLLSGRAIPARSLAGTQVTSDWNPILGMKRFMDWGQKNIIGPNMKRLNLKENELARQKVLIYIEYMSHPPFLIAIDKARTVKNLKQMMEKTLSLYNYIATNATQMRLLYNGQLQDDKSKLIDVLKGGATEARMAMVTTKPSIVPTFTDRVALPEMPEEQRQANQTLNSCRILLRNFSACNSNAEGFRKPSDRVRFNTPVTKTQPNVVSEDLGEFIIDVSKEVKKYSVSLNRLANKMTQDKNMDRNSLEYERYKTDIQNLMDAARYASPMFMNMAKFTLPLSQPSPRRVSVMPRRGRGNPA